MGRWQAIALGLGSGLLLAAGTATPAGAQGQSATLPLTSQNNSGITGTAALTDLGGGKLRVEIRADRAGAGPQPAHIHEGSCAQLNPAPKFSLADVVNGASTTELDGSLQQVTSAPHAVHLHKSPEELAVYVACADVRAAGQPATLPRAGGAAAGAGMVVGLSSLGLMLVAMGYALQRRARHRESV